MHDVAKYGKEIGWKMPKAPSDIDLLASELSDAARQEYRTDPKTGKPYRANHCYTQGSQQFTLWFDIEEAPRPIMQKSLIQRREQVVGDCLQLTLDTLHWNSVHPEEEPIVMPVDFTEDVEWRSHAPQEKAS